MLADENIPLQCDRKSVKTARKSVCTRQLKEISFECEASDLCSMAKIEMTKTVSVTRRNRIFSKIGNGREVKISSISFGNDK